MSGERIFNIFVYFEQGTAIEYGVQHHHTSGTDDDKMQILLAKLDNDYPIAQRFRLSRSFSPAEWLAVFRSGQALRYFTEAFDLFDAPASIVFCITSIVGGRPVADKVIGAEPFQGKDVTWAEGRGAMPDYLIEYLVGDTVDFPRLIHDDYFIAIRTLYNARLFVSCAKLLMSAIDTLSFVEYGDTPRNFSKWLDAFVELRSLGITADELWEFRNSLLHMTNLSSRAVNAGTVSPLAPFIGAEERHPAAVSGQPKLFNLFGLMMAFADGIGNWAQSYNADPNKFLKFIERYDTTISDSRTAIFEKNITDEPIT